MAIRLFCLMVLFHAIMAGWSAETPKTRAPSMSEILASSKPGDWRPLTCESTDARRYETLALLNFAISGYIGSSARDAV